MTLTLAARQTAAANIAAAIKGRAWTSPDGSKVRVYVGRGEDYLSVMATDGEIFWKIRDENKVCASLRAAGLIQPFMAAAVPGRRSSGMIMIATEAALTPPDPPAAPAQRKWTPAERYALSIGQAPDDHDSM